MQAETPLSCPACAHANPPGSRFCNACGAPLTAPPDALTAVGSAAPLPAIGPTLAQRPPVALPAPAAPLAEGATLGPAGRYLVERSIGRGGFGEAYLVYDRQLSRYCVAKRMALSAQLSERNRQIALHNFRREAQLLVTLNAPGHPHIPEIYEYLPEQACLVMKYIEGRNLDEALRERGGVLPQAEALALVRDICSALVYMHSRQPEPVLHRDIKPSNMLLDNAGRIWLIDFGLSKAVPAQLAAASDPQRTQLAGTLGFTPPEQWRGQAEPRSDVYALGATLHMLITGYRPQLGREDMAEFMRGGGRSFPAARQINPAVHPAIEQLIEHCLAYEPSQRPDSGALFSALDRHLAPAGQPTLQTPSGHIVTDEHGLAQWAERYWAEAATWLYTSLPAQVESVLGKNQLAAELRAIIAAQPGNQHAGLDAMIARLDPQGFGAARPRIAADQKRVDFGALEAESRADRWLTISNTGRRYAVLQAQLPGWLNAGPPSLALAPGQQGRLRLTADMRRASGSKLSASVTLLDRSGLGFRIEAQASLSRWRMPWARVTSRSTTRDWQQQKPRRIYALLGHRGGAAALAFSPSGALLASGGHDQQIRLWRPSDGAPLATLHGHSANLLSLSFSPAGQLLASASADETVRIWRVEDSRLLTTISANVGYFDSLCFSPDGQQLLAAAGDRCVRLWRVSDGAALGTIATELSIAGLALSPDGAGLLVGGADGRLRRFALPGGVALGELPLRSGPLCAVALSPDGQSLAVGSAEGTIFLWDMEQNSAQPRLLGHLGEVRSLSFHPDSELLASGGLDGTLRIWRLRDGELLHSLGGHSSAVARACFSPDGALLASAGGDGALVVWGAG